MRIGELAKRAGIGVETVRFYERKGLIVQPPKPKTGGYRDYAAQSVYRIKFIRRAQHLGFSLIEIAELLNLEAGRDARCIDVRRRAEIKREEVQVKIEDLKRIKKALDRLIEACPGSGPARKCSILDAINEGELHLNSMKRGANDARQIPEN